MRDRRLLAPYARRQQWSWDHPLLAGLGFALLFVPMVYIFILAIGGRPSAAAVAGIYLGVAITNAVLIRLVGSPPAATGESTKGDD